MSHALLVDLTVVDLLLQRVVRDQAVDVRVLGLSVPEQPEEPFNKMF